MKILKRFNIIMKERRFHMTKLVSENIEVKKLGETGFLWIILLLTGLIAFVGGVFFSHTPSLCWEYLFLYLLMGCVQWILIWRKTETRY